MGRPEASPETVCAKCGAHYADPYFKEVARGPYREPRRAQALLCGLWPFGAAGAALLAAAWALRLVWLGVLGGVVFLFWVLLVTVALLLWPEVRARARREYEASAARLARSGAALPEAQGAPANPGAE